MTDREDMARRKAVFRARTEHYASLGFDRFAAADFVIGTGGRLSGPALDVGTGKGLTAMALARRGLEVVSVDPDADELALACVLADEAGLAARIRFVHGEGREHSVSGVTPESAAAFLSMMGFAVEARLSGHKQDVIVLAKEHRRKELRTDADLRI